MQHGSILAVATFIHEFIVDTLEDDQAEECIFIICADFPLVLREVLQYEHPAKLN